MKTIKNTLLSNYNLQILFPLTYVVLHKSGVQQVNPFGQPTSSVGFLMVNKQLNRDCKEDMHTWTENLFPAVFIRKQVLYQQHFQKQLGNKNYE